VSKTSLRKLPGCAHSELSILTTTSTKYRAKDRCLRNLNSVSFEKSLTKPAVACKQRLHAPAQQPLWDRPMPQLPFTLHPSVPSQQGAVLMLSAKGNGWCGCGPVPQPQEGRKKTLAEHFRCIKKAVSVVLYLHSPHTCTVLPTLFYPLAAPQHEGP